MTLFVTPKTRKEEKIVRAFLKSLSIGFYNEAEEDAALLKAMEKGRKARLLKPGDRIDFLQNLKTAK